MFETCWTPVSRIESGPVDPWIKALVLDVASELNPELPDWLHFHYVDLTFFWVDTVYWWWAQSISTAWAIQLDWWSFQRGFRRLGDVYPRAPLWEDRDTKIHANK